MNQKLRIAIAGTRGIPANYGGFETFAEEVSQGLANNGYEVTVYCEHSDYPKPHFNNVRLRYVPIKKSTNQAIYFLLSFWYAIKENDVVIVTSTGASYFYFLNKVFFKRIVITNTDGLESRRSKWSFFKRKYLHYSELFAVKTSDALVADSKGIAQYLSHTYSNLPPVSIIEYGAPVLNGSVDNSYLEFGLSKAAYYLIVARLEPENNLLMMLEGYAKANTTMPLVVIGNLQDTAYVKELKKFESGKIRFLGGIYDKAKLNSLRKNAFAYLHGHSVGGTNPSLLEAMGAFSVCICHNNIYNREVTADAMYYFDSADDVSAIISQLESLSAEELQQKRMQAAERIREYYNWPNMLAKYENTIQTLSKLKRPQLS